MTTSPDGLGKINLEVFAAPKDTQWWAKKQHPTQFADAKHEPGVTYAPKEPTAEAIAEFIDKHAMKLLSTTEQGQEFLKQLNEGLPEGYRPEGWDQ